MKKLLSILFLSALVTTDAAACSCGLKALDDFVDNADSIHIATLQQAKLSVGEYDKKSPIIDGVFIVRKTLKGNAQTTAMSLSTSASDVSCGIPMIVSASYLIFKKNGQTGVSTCDGSTAFDDFHEDDVVAKVRDRLKNKGSRRIKK